MASETFLLGYNESANPEQSATMTRIWIKKLGQLGVGALEGIEPVIFRPVKEPYLKLSQEIATAIGSQQLFDLDVTVKWPPPFINRIIAENCLTAGPAWILHQAGFERQRH